MSVYGNAVGGSSGLGKTLMFVDEAGNEFVGVVTDSEMILTASDNDVREGAVYVSDNGLSVGTKNIPVYYARYGSKFVLANNKATLSVPEYDYDSIMITISTYNSSLSESVTSTYLSVYDSMYIAGNNIKVSDIIVDKENEEISLGITVSEKSVLRYFVIKEEY